MYGQTARTWGLRAKPDELGDDGNATGNLPGDVRLRGVVLAQIPAQKIFVETKPKEGLKT